MALPDHRDDNVIAEGVFCKIVWILQIMEVPGTTHQENNKQRCVLTGNYSGGDV